MLVCPLCRLALSDTETICPRDGQSGAPARSTDVPAVVRARFGIVQSFAQGASGDLYVADDQQTGRRGVLKLLRLPSSVTPAEKARLKRELVKQATLGAATLSVPLATGDANGVPWLFREWHEGVSLRVKLARGGALAVPEALAVTAQVASALDELHRSGLLHRDVKPGHILLNPLPTGLPRVTLIDPGIAARIETGAVFDVMGTPEYVSPEQAKGKLVSFRSDLYALGCVLYEMLTGRLLFEGTPEELLEAHASQPVPTLQVSVPTGVATLLAQLLAKDPRERPFSAQQVRRTLEPFLPEDASSRREATQTFDKVAASAPKLTPSGSSNRSGTLRPPQQTIQGSAAPPPPPGSPRPDATEELQALDLEQAEEVSSRPRRPRAVKTLLGIAAQPTPSDATSELTALDLEQAEQALQPAPSAPAVAEPAARGVAPSPPVRMAPPPWEQSTLHSGEGPGLDFDYDDLAETMAVDRDRVGPSKADPGFAASGAPAVQSGPAQPVQPAQPAQPAQSAQSAAQQPSVQALVPAKKRKSSGGVIAIVALVGVLGFCGLAAVGGAGFMFYGLQSAPGELVEPTAAEYEPEPAPPVVVAPPPPVFVPAPPAPVAAPEPPPVPEPAPPVEVEPPAVVAEPTPPPVVAEPALPPPVVPEVAATPAPRDRGRSSRSGDRAQQATAPSPTSPAPAASDDRAARFERVRQQALEHFRARRFPQAAQSYEEATDLNPRHAGSYAGLGASRLAMGQPPQAVRAYERAVALQPSHAGYHAALGQAYLQAGDSARARQSFTRALSLDANNASARQGLQRLGG